jgi:catechol 2,3-dioxygenase-like lactoylglutathione lyase family enzyme
MFDQLDFIYMPSRDAAADVRFWTDVLGARLRFAVEGMGTRVAMLELGTPPPAILLAEHLEGDAPVLVFRVADLEAAMADLTARGWVGGTRLEIPHGPICAFTAPGGQRLAVYQLTRPDAGEHFAGRVDF